ncbi:MAG: efflux RND transporter periplasmic adaptor subunit [Clostridia bacterium]|nr:efflux RND transporter periplasmic adaptor subunit [Clostridia bacterium]
MKNLLEKIKVLHPKKMPKKWLVITGIALAIVIAIVLVTLFGRNHQQEEQILTAVADTGDVEVIISGTGMIEPNASYEVTALVKGEIIEAPFEEGTVVEKGDLLYRIDTADVENSIERSKLSLERSQDTYNQNMDDISKLSVRSKESGNITALHVKKGDKVSAGSKIADVVNSHQLILKIPFISEHAEQISTGETAEITLQSGGGTLYGTVSRISSGELVSEAGIIVKNVEIEVENPGNILEGDTATAIVGEVSCNDLGSFSYPGSDTVTAEVSGEVEEVYVMEGDYVSAGSVLVKLSSTSLEQNGKSSSLSLREAQLSLENQYEQLENYNITSPINGTVIQKNSKQGDILDNTNNTKVMATIADMSKILFEMSVDELDISKIKVGQTAVITADALEDKVFSGYVETVSVIGTSSNGVTTYPVTVVVNEPEGLIPGMNVSADIIVEKKENVVRIPASALMRGNQVAVQLKDGEKAPEKVPADGGEMPKNSKMMMNTAPDGFKLVKVKVGLSNEDYVEIMEGISEGDVVKVTAEDAPSASIFQNMGAMPQGMPSGGMPSGGMPGSGMPGGR